MNEYAEFARRWYSGKFRGGNIETLERNMTSELAEHFIPRGQTVRMDEIERLMTLFSEAQTNELSARGRLADAISDYDITVACLEAVKTRISLTKAFWYSQGRGG